MRLRPTDFALILLLAFLLGTLRTFSVSATPDALPTRVTPGPLADPFPGTIAFLDSEGANPITHVSLNGPATTDGIRLQITDKDLDVIIKREGDDADILSPARITSGVVQPLQGEAWYDLQDMNEDGWIDSRDIRALDDAGNSLVTGSATVWYDRTNSILRVPTNTAKLEYWIKTKTTLGAGSAEPQSGAERRDEASYASLTNGSVIPAPPDHSLLPAGYGWIDVLHARFGNLKTRTDKAVADQELIASIRAYNEIPADENEGDLRIDADFTVAGGGGQTPASVTIKVFDGTAIGEPGDPGFIPAATVGVGKDGQDTDVVVEYEYWGTPASALPDRTASSGQSQPQSTGLVTISSDAVPKGINILLEETHAASGVFAATIVICEFGSDGCEAAQEETVTLPVNKVGDDILIAYEDDSPFAIREAILPLDVRGPDFALFSPARGHAGREDEPTVSFQVTDAESGLSDSDDAIDSVYVVAGLYDLEAEQASDSVVFERNEVGLTSILDGYVVSVTIDEGRGDSDELDERRLTDDSQYEIRWWAVSADLAGNVSVSDADGETDCGIATDSLKSFKFATERSQAQADALIAALENTIDFKKGCDPHVIRVDTAKPSLKSAVTGTWLDGEVVKEGPDAIRTSVSAVFDEDVDCASVSVDGFKVDGDVPSDVACKDSSVYLVVDELSSDATPKVAVAAGAVADRAGNPVKAGSVTAEDSIPAKLVVTVAGTGGGETRPVTRRVVTVTITSDERLSGNPIVTINRVGDEYSLIRADQKEAIASGGPNRWVYTTGLSREGLYNVRVSGLDMGGRIETAVGLDETDFDATSLKDPKAVLFEVDANLRSPSFWPEDNAETDNSNAFIRIDFSREAGEYGLTRKIDNDAPPPAKIRMATTDPSLVDVNFDAHVVVTITEAIFDGVDVTDEVVTRDGMLFYYLPDNLDLGEHALELEARDVAGNSWSDTLNFSVIERQPFKLPINPGLNLVSLPADPEDGSIESVFGHVPEITTVVTYDNSMKQWVAATRGEGGAFAGDLTAIDADHGYFIAAEDPLVLEAMLKKGDELAIFLPAIEIVKGWNLVPIADLAQRPAGTPISAAGYFANIDATAALGYDSIQQKMTRLSLAKNSDDEIFVGSAHWVYANKDGVIIP